MGAGPEIGPTDPTGRSGGRDHRSFNGLARGDRNITFDTGASNMTEALASKTCTPCRGGIPPLTREQAELFHAQAPDWQLPEEAHRIERSFRFRNFREALTFVQEIGELAEAEGHHPNISFGWGNATVSLQTKKIKGLHENDFIMATKIDRIFARTATA